MKTITYIIGAVGFILAFVPMCCDVTECPLLAIPIIFGFLLVVLSSKLEKGWAFGEKENFNSYYRSDDSDDGITWITDECSRAGRYVDFR